MKMRLVLVLVLVQTLQRQGFVPQRDVGDGEMHKEQCQWISESISRVHGLRRSGL